MTAVFEMREQRERPGTVRLSLCGELDLAVAGQLTARLNELAHHHQTVILDLAGLQFIDSTGLRTLLTQINHANNNGWQLRIDPHLTPTVRRTIELSGLTHILPA